MTKDARLYAKFTLDFPEHEKVLPLSDAAFRCLVEATIWSRKQLTDGWLARRLALAKWSLDVLQELSTNDDDKPSLIASEDGWLIRDFAEHQDTKAEIEERRERARFAGQMGGLAKSKRTAKRRAKRPASKMVSKTVAETETETDITTTDKSVVVAHARTRGARLPNGWTPPHDVVAQMRSDHPQVDLKSEHAKFVDYWQGKAGKDARKADWAATWRNWIRRAAEQNRNGQAHAPPSNGVGKPTQKALGYQQAAERLIAGMEHQE